LASSVLGVDFTCAPTARKPITAAWGLFEGQVVKLHSLVALPSLHAFEQMLIEPSPAGQAAWLGAFDFPFGLPRCFVDALHAFGATFEPSLNVTNAQSLIQSLRAVAEHTQACPKASFQQLVDGWGKSWGHGSRPSKLPHRHTDTAMLGVTSTSPLQTRYVPVGKMYIEGLWRLMQAPIDIPLLRPMSHASCHAFEAYPALLASEVLEGNGPAHSYKNDSPGMIDQRRLLNRLTLIDRLEQGRTRLNMRLKLTPAQREHIASDTQGDRLDAVLCMLQAAWAARAHAQGDAHFGLPPTTDPVEGWILTA
jgi:Protein of unknown function (DUF429)